MKAAVQTHRGFPRTPFGALVIAGLASLTFGAGRVPAYHAPAAEDPHAIVKFRRTYETGGGTSLREQLRIDDHSAYQHCVPSALSATARIDSTFVWPLPATYSFRSEFFHTEIEQVWETYYEQVSSLETESYNCGTGTSYQMCTRTVTRYHSEPRERLVTKSVEVSDGACETGTHFAARANRVYLLQYTYQSPNACSLRCFEQAPQADGTFQNHPCSVALPTAQ